MPHEVCKYQLRRGFLGRQPDVGSSCNLTCGVMLTICKDALACGCAGVMHRIADWHLHASNGQLVIPLVDACILNIQLGDAAETQKYHQGAI